MVCRLIRGNYMGLKALQYECQAGAFSINFNPLKIIKHPVNGLDFILAQYSVVQN